MLVDLRSKGVTGKATEKLLDTVNITCNKNAIPMILKSHLQQAVSDLVQQQLLQEALIQRIWIKLLKQSLLQ